MKFFLFLSLTLASLSAFADCEADLTGFQVGFPIWSQGSRQTTFSLTSRYQQMTVLVRDADLSDSRVRAIYDLLQDAGYSQGFVNFGVTQGVCVYLDQYQLPVGFGGSWTSLDARNIISMSRADQR